MGSSSATMGSQLRALLRTVFEATFAPSRFLLRWREHPERYVSPARLLAINSLLVGGVNYLQSKVGPWANADNSLGPSRPAAVAGDLLSALLPIVVIWAGIVGIFAGTRIVGARAGWDQAKRLAAFLSATYVLTTPPLLALGLLGTGLYLPMLGIVVALDVMYMAIGMNPIYGLAGHRRAGATAASVVLQYGLGFLVFALLNAAAILVLIATGNLASK